MRPSATPPSRKFSNQNPSRETIAQSSPDAYIAAVMGPGPYHNLRQGAVYRIEKVMQDFRERIVYSLRDETTTMEDRDSWPPEHEEIFCECFDLPRGELKEGKQLALRKVGSEIRVTCEFVIDLSDDDHNRFLKFRGHRGIVWFLDIICDDLSECDRVWEMVQERYFLTTEVPTSPSQSN